MPKAFILCMVALAMLPGPAEAFWKPLVAAAEITASTAIPLRPQEQGQPVSTPSQGWALAASALLTESSGGRHDLLGGAVDTDLKQSTQLLRTWWDINNRSDLLATLKWLDEEGHRKRFEHFGARLSALTVEEKQALLELRREDETLDHRVTILERHFQRLGPRSLLGWDLSRYIALCRWGYLIGYLSEAEAWALIMPAARRLQLTFDSWRDLGENYLIGRQFWSLDETKQTGHLYEAAYERLLSRPESPWNRYPWNTALGPAAAERPR